MPDLEKDCLDLQICSSFDGKESMLVVPTLGCLSCLESCYTAQDKAAVKIKLVSGRVCDFSRVLRHRNEAKS